MTQEEILEKIQKEYPAFAKGAKKLYEAGDDLTELLQVLESFY